MRAFLIHNPAAGDGHPTRSQLCDLVHSAGFDAEYLAVGVDPLSPEVITRAAPDLVVVAGGDGTVRNVAAALRGLPVAAAIVPIGTANNVARAIGGWYDEREIVRSLQNGKTVTVDTANVEMAGQQLMSIEATGVGVIAEYMRAVQALKGSRRLSVAEEKKVALETLMATISNAPPIDMSVRLDGREVAGRYLMLQAMNIGLIGRNLCLAPLADPMDGRLDVVFVPSTHRSRLISFVEALIAGEAHTLNLEVRRAYRVEIRCRTHAIHVDDLLWPFQGAAGQWPELAVTTSPGSVTFLVPPGSARARRGG